MYSKDKSKSSQNSAQFRIAFTGTHTLTQNSFIISGQKFIIKQRKQAGAGKPDLYICAISPFRYISSLYQKTDKSVIMEYLKDYYQVLISADSIEFKRL